MPTYNHPDPEVAYITCKYSILMVRPTHKGQPKVSGGLGSLTPTWAATSRHTTTLVEGAYIFGGIYLSLPHHSVPLASSIMVNPQQALNKYLQNECNCLKQFVKKSNITISHLVQIVWRNSSFIIMQMWAHFRPQSHVCIKKSLLNNQK